jgi:transcriptional regulator with XRE-family HTH domain
MHTVHLRVVGKVMGDAQRALILPVNAQREGTANPSIGTLCKLAATLRVSLTDLLGQDEQTSSTEQVVKPDQVNDL